MLFSISFYTSYFKRMCNELNIMDIFVKDQKIFFLVIFFKVYYVTEAQNTSRKIRAPSRGLLGVECAMWVE